MKELPVVLQAFHGVREQLWKPARILGFGLRHIPHAFFKMLPRRVDGSDHDLVAQDEIQVDPVGWDFDLAISASDAGEHEYTVLGECLHALENHRGVSG